MKVALAVLIALQIPSSAQSSSWQESLAKGQAELTERRYKQALETFEGAVPKIPTNDFENLALIQYYRARSLEGLGELLQAQQSVRLALSYQSGNPTFKEYLRQLEEASANQIATAGDIVSSLSSPKNLVHGPDTSGHGALIDLHINFEFGKDTLQERGRTQTANLAKALQSPVLSSNRFRLIGHTDLIGPRDYNQDLSLRRARTVWKSLITEFGIDSMRLEYEGHGLREPRSHGISVQDNKINRRVAVEIIE